jgi:hypothetical protein
MLNSSIKDNTIKAKTSRNTPLIITTFIAVVGFLLSMFNFYDSQLRSNVDVIAGRQIRLFVAFEDKGQGKGEPCIMMNLVYTNQGGKTGTVFDTKLDVKWLFDNKIVLERQFKALRELDNFIRAEGDCAQYPISPVVVLGKSNEVRRYVFLPYETIRQEDIPKNFDLEIAVYTQTMNEWLLKSRYRANNISDVWQDLAESTFRDKVLDIREIK